MQREVRDEERDHRLREVFVKMNTEDMPLWLCRFVTEERRVDGKLYLPNTLHQLTCGLLRALKQDDRAEVNFFLTLFFLLSRALWSPDEKIQSTGEYVQKQARTAYVIDGVSAHRPQSRQHSLWQLSE